MNPKTQTDIQQQINQTLHEQAKPRYGTITSYNRYSNTATVAISSADSDQITEILTNVPCPVYMGLQLVAPEPGRPCWVVFKNDREAQPMISHYFNHSYQKFDFGRSTYVGSGVPNYMIG